MERLINRGNITTRERVRNLGIAATLIFSAGIDLAACSTSPTSNNPDIKPGAAQPLETKSPTQAEVFFQAARELGINPSASEKKLWKDGYSFDPNTSLALQTEDQAGQLAEARIIDTLSRMPQSDNSEFSNAGENILIGSNNNRVVLEIVNDPEMKVVTTGEVDSLGELYFGITLSYQEIIDGSSSLTLADSFTFANISMEIINDYFKSLPDNLSVAEKEARINAFQNTPEAYQAELFGRLSKSVITQTGLLNKDYSIDEMATDDITELFINTGMDYEDKAWSDKLRDFFTANPQDQQVS